MVTIYDIAKKCGLSASTVSKVINNYPSIPLKTKEKVRATMQELNYIPNINAALLSKGTSNNVGVISCFGTSITPFKHPFFLDVLDSFQNEMNKNKYDLVFISRALGKSSGTFYENCVSRQVSGTILLGDILDKEMQEVISSDMPSVGFDYIGDKMPGVFTNNYEMMKKLTNFLIHLGHKNIVYISGENNPITNDRVNGFKDALKTNNICFNEKMLIQSKYVDFEDIELIVLDLLKRENIPTAIMFPDDYSALKCMDMLRRKGYSCPDDISITGFDGIEIGQLVYPKLTTIKQDSKKIGKVLAKQLINMMKTKEKSNDQIMIDGELIIGESTKRII